MAHFSGGADPTPEDGVGRLLGRFRRSGISKVARGAARAALGVLLPPVCLSCHRPLSSRDAVCSDCWREITFIRAPLCDRLGLPMPFDSGGRMVSAAAKINPPAYRKARAVAQYDGAMRRLIHGFKFSDRLEARVLFGQWLVHAGAELIDEADVIVPVPLSRLRLLGRRFNQSAILAREVASRGGPVFAPRVLVRSRGTRAQVGLSRARRKTNVAGAFKVAQRRVAMVKDLKILLVDDVITTGATVDACARALLKAGARYVDVLSLGIVTDTGRMST